MPGSPGVSGFFTVTFWQTRLGIRDIGTSISLHTFLMVTVSVCAEGWAGAGETAVTGAACASKTNTLNKG